MTHRRRVADFWDRHVASWLAGDDPLEPPLPDWFASFAGAVTREGFVEPYIGDLRGIETEPRMVVLGLNPGQYFPDMQARNGLFAEEIRQAGGYSAWAATHPYDREPWWSFRGGKNTYFTSRLAFTANWLQEPAVAHNDMLIFELYPWHSTAVTAPMQPPGQVIEQFVWQPVSEIDTSHVFAFGKHWANLAGRLNLPLVARLGADGEPYGSQVPSRAVRVHRLPSGQQLVIEWHAGSAGPPRRDEAALLRRRLSPPH
jgi:hypothetical protein